jgi:Family of unknown function (DUF5313)
VTGIGQERLPSADPVARPAPHRWLAYAFGGRLPERNRGWVLHDTTTATWWLRHLARTGVQLAVPIVLVVVLLPAPWVLRLACALGGIFLALIYSLAYMNEATENRVVKAGYPAGTAQAVREQASMVRQQRESERKRAAAARRAARYRRRAGL